MPTWRRLGSTKRNHAPNPDDPSSEILEHARVLRPNEIALQILRSLSSQEFAQSYQPGETAVLFRNRVFLIFEKRLHYTSSSVGVPFNPHRALLNTISLLALPGEETLSR